ncbi:mycothiol transferase [Ruania halotolerans]|uniref:mycothiol transferase n=1 Tax=Ruania halotolerans TaxID=2897773 RepID=UPI001E313842|nr:DinB family protein [Ruania halotolerans]UFU05250.1 DinB family protein [Ruania halotolerans]
MSSVSSILRDGFSRVTEELHAVLGDPHRLTPEHLVARLDPDANTIAWLAWHLTRVQDDHVSEVAGLEQQWTAGGWADRFDLPFEVADHGFGHSSAQVAQVRGFSAADLLGYHDAVSAATTGILSRLDEADLDRVVDDAWDPPVTLGVRLVSVLAEGLQHVGQIAYIAGVLERSGPAGSPQAE